MIYFDHAATTPMDEEVVDVITTSMRKDFANPGTVYKIGLEAKNLIDGAVNDIREKLNVPSSHRIIFSSGGSEANNLFIKGLSFSASKVAFSGLEHPSIMETIKFLENDSEKAINLNGYQVDGRLDINSIAGFSEKGIRLLCLSHVNNEIGSVNSTKLICEKLANASSRTRLFIDGVQAIGKVFIGPGFWSGIDGYSISAHKINGPKGIGVLVYDSKLNLDPIIHGGGQQYGIRSGTMPAPLILGMAHSIKLAVDRQESSLSHFIKLKSRLVDGLMELDKFNETLSIKMNSLSETENFNQSPHIVNFSFPPVEGEVLLHHLEGQEIYVGMGSACSAKSKEPSKILKGIGLTDEQARCSLRISFGLSNTISEIDTFLHEFSLAYKNLYPSFKRKTFKV
jgi:cysteine desulfurase